MENQQLEPQDVGEIDKKQINVKLGKFINLFTIGFIWLYIGYYKKFMIFLVTAVILIALAQFIPLFYILVLIEFSVVYFWGGYDFKRFIEVNE